MMRAARLSNMMSSGRVQQYGSTNSQGLHPSVYYKTLGVVWDMRTDPARNAGISQFVNAPLITPRPDEAVEVTINIGGYQVPFNGETIGEALSQVYDTLRRPLTSTEVVQYHALLPSRPAPHNEPFRRIDLLQSTHFGGFKVEFVENGNDNNNANIGSDGMRLVIQPYPGRA